MSASRASELDPLRPQGDWVSCLNADAKIAVTCGDVFGVAKITSSTIVAEAYCLLKSAV